MILRFLPLSSSLMTSTSALSPNGKQGKEPDMRRIIIDFFITLTPEQTQMHQKLLNQVLQDRGRGSNSEGTILDARVMMLECSHVHVFEPLRNNSQGW
jgi:hypothetical protein